MYFTVLVSIVNNHYKQFKKDASNCLSLLYKKKKYMEQRPRRSLIKHSEIFWGSCLKLNFLSIVKAALMKFYSPAD